MPAATELREIQVQIKSEGLTQVQGLEGGLHYRTRPATAKVLPSAKDGHPTFIPGGPMAEQLIVPAWVADQIANGDFVVTQMAVDWFEQSCGAHGRLPVLEVIGSEELRDNDEERLLQLVEATDHKIAAQEAAEEHQRKREAAAESHRREHEANEEWGRLYRAVRAEARELITAAFDSVSSEQRDRLRYLLEEVVFNGYPTRNAHLIDRYKPRSDVEQILHDMLAPDDVRDAT